MDRDRTIRAFMKFLDDVEKIKTGEIIIYFKNGETIVLRPEIKEPARLKLVSSYD